MIPKLIAAIILAVTIALLIIIQAWKLKCLGDQDTRIFNHAKNVAINASQEFFREDQDLYLEAMKRKNNRLEELDRKIKSREATLETLRETITNRQKKKIIVGI